MKNLLLLLCTIFSISSFAQITATEQPRVTFGELKSEGPFTRADVILQDRILVSSGDDNTYKVIQYTISLEPKNDSATQMQVSGNTLTEAVKNELYKLTPGDKITISGVMAMVKNDPYDFRMLSPITLLLDGGKLDMEKSRKYTEKTYGNIGYPTDTTEIRSDVVTPTRLDEVASSNDTRTYAVLGDIQNTGQPIAKEDIIKQKEINVVSKDSVTYTVGYFTMIIAYKNSPARSMSSASNKLTENMTTLLKSLNSGDRVLIEGIKAETVIDGKTYRAFLSPFIITVR